MRQHIHQIFHVFEFGGKSSTYHVVRSSHTLDYISVDVCVGVLCLQEHGFTWCKNNMVQQKASAKETDIVGKLLIEALYQFWQLWRNRSEHLRLGLGAFDQFGSASIDGGIVSVHQFSKHFLKKLTVLYVLLRSSGCIWGNTIAKFLNQQIANHRSQFRHGFQCLGELGKWLETTETIEQIHGNGHFRLVVVVRVVLGVVGVKLFGQLLIRMSLNR